MDGQQEAHHRGWGGKGAVAGAQAAMAKREEEGAYGTRTCISATSRLTSPRSRIRGHKHTVECTHNLRSQRASAQDRVKKWLDPLSSAVLT